MAITDPSQTEQRPSPAPPERVAVSVLIPVRNEERHIRDTVAAMRAQRFDGILELLFVDGRSTDRTRALLEELAAGDERIVVLDNPARRTTDGLNIGLAHARGEYVARMDAHTFYGPDYIALGVERLRRGDVHWVAGPAVPHGVDRWSRRVALALESGLGTVGSRKWSADGAERELDTGVFAGVWRRSTLVELGGWDPRWPINQDSELASRALARGQRIVLVPGMAARYIPRDSLRRLATQYGRYGYYRAKTACAHPDSARRSHALAPAVALAASAAALPFPAPVRRGAGALLGAYASALVVAAARVRQRAPAPDAAAVPLVSAIMHLAWGYGYLWGSLRHGPPLRALARAAIGGRPR